MTKTDAQNDLGLPAVAAPFDPARPSPPATRIVADARNAGPRDKDGVFALITGRPIFWGGRGSMHAVEGADVHTGVRLLWTRCKIDVPAGEAFVTDSPSIVVTCKKCSAALALAEPSST